MLKQYTEQEQQDIYLLKLIPIKNIQISYLGCHIVVFEKTAQEVINILKKLGFEHYKSGVYHRLLNKQENKFYCITNTRNQYYSLKVNPEIITDLNLNRFYV